MKKRSERIKEEHEMQRAKRHKKLASFAVKGATLLSFSVVAGALLDYQASVKADEVTQGIRRYHTNNFVNALVPSAQRVARSNDLYTSVMIAQAALESGWGNSTLAKAPNYNLFGVKGSYNGQSVSMKTLEDAGGQNYYQITANFRKYPNYEASLNDYAKILTGDREGDWRSNYYRGARRSNTKTYKDATAWLTGRYATDSAYGSKLNSIIESFNLTAFDGESVAESLPQANSSVGTANNSARTEAKPAGQSTASKPSVTQTNANASSRTIQVKAGDGFYALAHRAGVSMDALLKANGLTIGSMIHPGQQLKLPGDAPVTQSQSASQAAKPQTPTSEVSGQTSVNRQQTPASKSEASGRTIQVKAGDGFY
ncbi:LysM peptidoglycan-binding domain-containing protein, partial [Atopobacter sp. AH10]|uniref:glucosaminidase domain-containing protein n=1 Tax=Atopobacter sp. AH10 TaxID=2315861 RepID=UPI000EF20BBA